MLTAANLIRQSRACAPSDPGQALTLARQAVTAASRSKARSERVESLVRMGAASLVMHRLDEGMEAISKAEALSDRTNSELFRELLLWKSDGLFRSGRVDAAKTELNRLVRCCHAVHDVAMLSRAQGMLAKCWTLVGDTVVADAFAGAAMHSACESGEILAIARAGEARCFSYVRSAPQFLDSFDSVLATFRDAGAVLETAGLMSNIAFAFAKTGQAGRAIRLLQESESMALSVGHAPIAGHARSFQCRILGMLGESREAIQIQRGAISLLDGAGAPLSYMHALNMLTNALLNDGEYDEAASVADDGAREARTYRSRPDLIAMEASLVSAYQQMGNMKRAAEHYAEYRRLKMLDASQFNLEGMNDSEEVDRNLTPTERSICVLLQENLRSQEIADRLNVSLHTIETHRRNIRRKLDVPRGGNLVTWLRRHTH